MKMKGRKAVVFWTVLIVLVALYLFTAKYASAALPSVGPVIIIMIVGNGATYIGGNSFDKWQKSKFFRSELDRR
jgi:hypothetical protein